MRWNYNRMIFIEYSGWINHVLPSGGEFGSSRIMMLLSAQCAVIFRDAFKKFIASIVELAAMLAQL